MLPQVSVKVNGRLFTILLTLIVGQIWVVYFLIYYEINKKRCLISLIKLSINCLLIKLLITYRNINVFLPYKYCAITFVDEVVLSIIVEIIFSWKLENNLSYWFQMWQQQFSQTEGAAEQPAKYHYLGIIHLRLQKWLENVWFPLFNSGVRWK